MSTFRICFVVLCTMLHCQSLPPGLGIHVYHPNQSPLIPPPPPHLPHPTVSNCKLNKSPSIGLRRVNRIHTVCSGHISTDGSGDLHAAKREVLTHSHSGWSNTRRPCSSHDQGRFVGTGSTELRIMRISLNRTSKEVETNISMITRTP